MSIISLLCRRNDFQDRIEQMRPRLYRLAYSWCHNAALADDLVQETMIKALKNANQLRDPLMLNSWLFSIMTNCWHDHFRRHKEMEDIDTPEFTHAQSQIIARVRAAVEMLPLAQRQVVTLVDLEEFSYIEVASILNIPIGTVMSRLCRARSRMKEQLNEFAPQKPVHSEKIRRIK
jgi:RNA polymerase sigma-70 factor (ECF subfamily)